MTAAVTFSRKLAHKQTDKGNQNKDLARCCQDEVIKTLLNKSF